jgi:microcystin-dependent protein
MPRGWLTPDSIPTGQTCRVLFLPDDEAFIAIVTGALNNLVEPWNFDQYGTLTPQQTADAFVEMFDKFCNKEGFCRVIGEIIPFAGSITPFPGKWLVCDGSDLLCASYPDLYAVVGTTYGSSGSGRFNLPDLRGRVPLMAGSGSGLSPRGLGDILGEETHQLSIGELASHNHTTGNSLLIGTQVPPPLDGLGPNPLPAFTGSEGGDQPHNNMQPSLAINYLIVALN